jgi:hypothetical protein
MIRKDKVIDMTDETEREGKAMQKLFAQVGEEKIETIVKDAITKKERVYWLDEWEGEATGGVYYRNFDFMEFIKKVEETQGKVVGISLDGSHNIQFIVERVK